MIEIIPATEAPSKKADPAKAPGATPETAAAKPTPALIVFGTDKDGKPHASCSERTPWCLGSPSRRLPR